MMTPDEIRIEWQRLVQASHNPREVEQVAAELEVDVDAYLENATENLVAAAVEAGVITWDGENTGWHEGWTRMLRALDTFVEGGR